MSDRTPVEIFSGNVQAIAIAFILGAAIGGIGSEAARIIWEDNAVRYGDNLKIYTASDNRNFHLSLEKRTNAPETPFIIGAPNVGTYNWVIARP